MLQNLPYFWKKKTQKVFSFFISSYFGFVTVDGRLVDIDQGKNMANFEVFLWSFSVSTNPEIARCDEYDDKVAVKSNYVNIIF